MTLSTRLLLTASIASGCLGAEPIEPQIEAELTVWLYDYADVAPGTLQRSQQQATRILNQVGLHIRWELCPTSAEDAEQNRGCARRAAVDTIRLGILSKKMAKRMASKGIQFGYAVPVAASFGVIAGVFYDRTIREADSVGLPRHMMLGHTMAHEIGHLLLGPGSHSPQGIMSPNWRQRQILLVRTSAFLFTKEQAARIRAQARARIEHAAVEWAERGLRRSDSGALNQIAWTPQNLK